MEIVYNAYYIILTVSCLISIFTQSKLLQINLLRIFLICTFLIESFASLAAQFLGNNIILLNIWIFLSVLIFIKILVSRINIISKKHEYLLLGGFLVFAFVNLIFWQGFNVYNTYSINLGSILIVILVFLHFKSLLDNPNFPIVSNPFFWISTGLLIFYVGGFLVNTFMNFLLRVDYGAAKDIFIILNILNCLTYSIFVLALYVDRRNKQVFV